MLPQFKPLARKGGQMDLSYNREPLFTPWVLHHGLLTSPLVAIDVGVQGGVSPRWKHLADCVEVHGFDALEEAVAPLRAEGTPKRHYYATALGNEDGERELFIAPEATASSFYASGPSPYDSSESVRRGSNSRRVPIRRLDSLMAEGTIPRADFIKIDCEGFEPEILKGAQALVGSGVFAIEVETNFHISATLPETHFWAVYKQLLPHGFLLCDLAFDRVQRASFANKARILGLEHPRAVAQPASFNVLFYRDTPSLGADETLKRAIILELYGMTDVAYDVVMANAVTLPEEFPLDEAAAHLVHGAKPWEIHDHNSVRVALRDSLSAIGAALRHSINHRLGRRRV